MLNRNDFILYLPMKGNVTDYGANSRTATNNSVSLTTDKNGLSNSAYEWNSTTDNLEFIAAVGNDLATAGNSGGVGIYFEANLVNPADNLALRLFSQYGNSGNRSISITLSTLNSLDDNCIARRYSDDGIGASGAETGINSVNYAVWNDWVLNITNQTTTNSDEVLKNSSQIDTESSLELMKEDSTFKFQIGYQNNGGTTNDSFQGKISNFIIKDKAFTKLESKYISKFGNRKRIA